MTVHSIIESRIVSFTTKFLPPTNTKGSRIRVSSNGNGTIIVPWDYSASDPHDAALRRALETWENQGIYKTVKGVQFVATTTKDGTGKVYTAIGFEVQ